MSNNLNTLQVVDENKEKFCKKANNQGREITHTRIDETTNYDREYSDFIVEIKLSGKVIIYNMIFQAQ